MHPHMRTHARLGQWDPAEFRSPMARGGRRSPRPEKPSQEAALMLRSGLDQPSGRERTVSDQEVEFQLEIETEVRRKLKR